MTLTDEQRQECQTLVTDARVALFDADLALAAGDIASAGRRLQEAITAAEIAKRKLEGRAS